MNTPAFRILSYRDFPCLLCLVCNRISHHPNDVKHHYCGHCHLFLDTVADDFPGVIVEGTSPGLLLEGAEAAPRTRT
jgi:hypothetical protein